MGMVYPQHPMAPSAVAPCQRIIHPTAVLVIARLIKAEQYQDLVAIDRQVHTVLPILTAIPVHPAAVQDMVVAGRPVHIVLPVHHPAVEVVRQVIVAHPVVAVSAAVAVALAVASVVVAVVAPVAAAVAALEAADSSHI